MKELKIYYSFDHLEDGSGYATDWFIVINGNLYGCGFTIVKVDETGEVLTPEKLLLSVKNCLAGNMYHAKESLFDILSGDVETKRIGLSPEEITKGKTLFETTEEALSKARESLGITQ